MFNIQNAFNQCKAFDKGRWYTNFIESDGETYTLTNCENVESILTTSSATSFITKPHFRIIDFKIDVHFVVTGTTITGMGIGSGSRDGIQRIYLNGLTAPKIDYITVYLFGYFDEIPEQTQSAQAVSAKMNSNEMVETPIGDETPTKIKL